MHHTAVQAEQFQSGPSLRASSHHIFFHLPATITTGYSKDLSYYTTGGIHINHVITIEKAVLMSHK